MYFWLLLKIYPSDFINCSNSTTLNIHKYSYFLRSLTSGCLNVTQKKKHYYLLFVDLGIVALSLMRRMQWKVTYITNHRKTDVENLLNFMSRAYVSSEHVPFTLWMQWPFDPQRGEGLLHLCSHGSKDHMTCAVTCLWAQLQVKGYCESSS